MHDAATQLRLPRLLRPFGPAIASTRGYTRSKFRRDLVAGLTVSVVELPQAMAYALIAGVPPQYGIYSSIIQGVLGALLSSSEHLTTGPTNTQSLLIASAVRPLVAPDVRPEVYLALVFLLTLMKGLVQLTLWGLRAGELVQFISRSVLVGVSAGAGVLIIVGQAGPLIGVHAASVSSLPGVLGSIVSLSRAAGGINWRAAAIAGGVIICCVIGRRLGRFVPGPLIGVIAACAAVAVLNWADRVPVLGALPHTLPHFQSPSTGGMAWDVIYTLLPGAIALALLGGIESVAIAKTIAARSGERIDANQEFFAQGFKNATTSFFQCIPGSASFTRSMLDYDAGAQTRWAAVMNAVLVGVLYFALADFARYLPLAALAGVLVVIAARLIDVAFFRRLARADKSDAFVLVVTFLAVLLTRLEFAIFVGIFVNIAFYLRTSSRLHIAEMEQTAGGTFVERGVYDRAGERRVAFLQLEGELFFAIADQLQDQLTTIRSSGVRVIILRLKRCHSIDGTVLDVLERFVSDTRRGAGHVLLCGVRPEVMKTIENYGLDQTIGRENIFPAESMLFAGAKKALDRARGLLGHSIDIADLEGEFAYDI